MKDNINYLLAFSLITITIIITFIPVFNASFVYDDHLFIKQNPLINNFNIPIYKIFLQPFPFKDHSFDLYRPLTTLFFRLNAQYITLNPSWLHIVNIFIHIFNTFLLFIFTKKILQSKESAFFISLIFAIMPGHSEAILWISGFSELIVTFLILSALLFYERNYSRFDAFHSIIIAIILFIGLLFKETMAVFLPIFFLLQIIKIKSKKLQELKNIFKNILPMIIMFLIYLIIRVDIIGHFIPTLDETESSTIIDRLPLIGKVYWKAFANLIYLKSPSIEYYWTDLYKITWESIAGWLLLITFLYILLTTKNNSIKYGILIFTIGFMLFSHLLVSTELFAERFLYLPSIGFCILFGVLIKNFLLNNKKKTIIYLLFFSWIIAIGTQTHNYSYFWKNDKVLWEYTNKIFPESPKAINNLSAIYFKNELITDAISFAEKKINNNKTKLLGIIIKVRAYGRLRQYKNGEKLCELHLKEFPKSTELLYLYGRHLIYLNKIDKAINTAERIKSIEKTNTFYKRLIYEIEHKTPLIKNNYYY